MSCPRLYSISCFLSSY